MLYESDNIGSILIVRYGELSLKTLYVRRRFESILMNNIRHSLDMNSIEHRLTREWGRIYVDTDCTEKAIGVLGRLFGVVSISPAVRVDSTLDSISLCAVSIIKGRIKKGESFALRVTRAGKHGYTSQEAARVIGDEIRRGLGASVNLSNPDVELFIEIRDNYAYLFFDRIRGPGGLPLGSQGYVSALIDTRESLLAAWYMMHRGCGIVFVLVDPGLSSILDSFIDTWCGYKGYRVYSIDKGSDVYSIVKDIAGRHGCLGVVTGLSLSYSSISVLKSMKESLGYPVFSPLIMMDREDIEDRLRVIGVSI